MVQSPKKLLLLYMSMYILRQIYTQPLSKIPFKNE